MASVYVCMYVHVATRTLHYLHEAEGSHGSEARHEWSLHDNHQDLDDDKLLMIGLERPGK